MYFECYPSSKNFPNHPNQKWCSLLWILLWNDLRIFLLLLLLVCVCVNILYLMLVLHDKCTLCRPEEILHPCFPPYFTGNTRCELRHSLYITSHDFRASSKLHTTWCLYAVTCSCSSSTLPSNTTSKRDDAFPHCILRPTAPFAHWGLSITFSLSPYRCHSIKFPQSCLFSAFSLKIGSLLPWVPITIDSEKSWMVKRRG